MRNNNYLSMIKKELSVVRSNFLDVANMVSGEVLECHVGYCNHGAT